ncbi:MAG TPA: FHA domain-containing protein [Sandaracinaceae bacterium LLY-WYZ-13_1]|nr:FHA domain-containing protein [Sandaracinaceae bacterium LLY-WYZ-13_1]
MARFRLRYQSTDLEMPVGEFTVGRSSSCHLALDDALVSRRHAVFHVREDGVEVEDLGSRNGVQVNGATIEGRRELKHLDRIVIGAQELLLVRVQAEDRKARGARPTLAGMTLDLPVIRSEADIPDEPTVHRSESVLDRIADKALALGRYDEAERMLSRRLAEMLREAQAGRKIPPEKLFAATGYALKLAEGTGKAAWLDWVFQAHDAAGALLDADAIGRLHELVRRIRYPGGKAFKAYLTNLRARAETLSPSERFLLQRLEGLERVVGA